jgi:hypothetical protein
MNRYIPFEPSIKKELKTRVQIKEEMTNKQTPAIIHLEFEQKREQRT